MTAPRPSRSHRSLHPGRRRSRAVLAATVLALPVLGGCSGGVDVASPRLDADDRAACESLVADLPQSLFGQERREVTPDDGITAAWGDPAVTLTCGAEEPDAFDAFSPCSEIEGVGWFLPDRQMKDASSDISMTAQSHSPLVLLHVPAEHRSSAPDTALADLAGPITENLDEVKPCH